VPFAVIEATPSQRTPSASMVQKPIMSVDAGSYALANPITAKAAKTQRLARSSRLWRGGSVRRLTRIVEALIDARENPQRPN
jgi:hypothetical protein